MKSYEAETAASFEALKAPSAGAAGAEIFDESSVIEYVEYLKNSQIPVKTINRRLSTLRRFGDFLMVWGLTKANSARLIANVSTVASSPSLLDQFAYDLREAPEARASILADLAEFMNVNNMSANFHE